jgi:hypothetical protein
MVSERISAHITCYVPEGRRRAVPTTEVNNNLLGTEKERSKRQNFDVDNDMQFTSTLRSYSKHPEKSPAQISATKFSPPSFERKIGLNEFIRL